LRSQEQVFGAGAPTEGHHRVVLQQEQDIFIVLPALVKQGLLQGETGVVGQAPGLERAETRAGRGAPAGAGSDHPRLPPVDAGDGTGIHRFLDLFLVGADRIINFGQVVVVHAEHFR
jgi:hypothetical protein